MASRVAVAGGSGDLGRLIVDALLQTRKHEVYTLSRKPPTQPIQRTSPLTNKPYTPLLLTDYSSPDTLATELSHAGITTVISAIIMDSIPACQSQLVLIRAAQRSPTVARLIPSEFNVDYDAGDDVLPYPDKEHHRAARRELERDTSSLEFAYVYPGMLMDYFGLPRIDSPLRPLSFFVDPENGVAVLPDDGEARMSTTLAKDLARYVALALDLEKWPRVMTVAASTVTLNELVSLVEKSTGRSLQVSYQPVEKLLKREGLDLPSNMALAAGYPERFPGGKDQVRALIGDLEAGVALGAFDLTAHAKKGVDQVDLVEAFRGAADEPKRLGEVIEEGWGGRL